MSVVATACGTAPTGPDLESQPAPSLGPVELEGSVASLEQLAFEALEGLADGDRDRMERIRLTAYQHNVLVWPELPASAPEVNYPVDLAWANISRRNERAVGRLLGMYEGRVLSLMSVECRDGVDEFPSFVVYRDCWVSLMVDRARVETRQLFKYVLDWNGQHKIFRYYDPD